MRDVRLQSPLLWTGVSLQCHSLLESPAGGCTYLFLFCPKSCPACSRVTSAVGTSACHFRHLPLHTGPPVVGHKSESLASPRQEAGSPLPPGRPGSGYDLRSGEVMQKSVKDFTTTRPRREFRSVFLPRPVRTGQRSRSRPHCPSRWPSGWGQARLQWVQRAGKKLIKEEASFKPSDLVSTLDSVLCTRVVSVQQSLLLLVVPVGQVCDSVCHFAIREGCFVPPAGALLLPLSRWFFVLNTK